MPDTSDDGLIGASRINSAALVPSSLQGNIVKLSELPGITAALKDMNQRLLGADVVRQTLDSVNLAAREALQSKVTLAGGLDKSTLDLALGGGAPRSAALDAACADSAKRAGVDIARVGEAARLVGADGLSRRIPIPAAESLAVNAGLARAFEQIDAVAAQSTKLRLDVTVNDATGASKRLQPTAMQAAVGEAQRWMRNIVEGMKPPAVSPAATGLSLELERMQLTPRAVSGGMTRELDAARRSLLEMTAISNQLGRVGVAPPAGQLGISGTRSLLAQAVNGLALQQGFLADRSVLSDLAGRIELAVDQAENTSFALWADVRQARDDALHGKEETVRRLARRWWKRSAVPKSWLMSNDGEPSAFATALVLLDLDQYSPDNAMDLLRAVPVQVRSVRRDECSFFEREVDHRLIESLDGRAEVLGVVADEVRVAKQHDDDVAREVLAALEGGDITADFTNPAVIKLLSVLRPEDVPLVLANLEHSDWKQTGAELGLAPGEAERVRDRVRYRMNSVKEAFGGVRPLVGVGGDPR